MVIYLTGESAAGRKPKGVCPCCLSELTPREINASASWNRKYIVGQNAAKKAVAVALRNRVRRQKLPPEMADDVLPKNILMIGPTGVGKTEVARRLARLAGCPFVKVEASKYTEVGYVGRDVESMVRDLVETAIDMVREEKLDEVAERAEQAAEERLLDLLLPSTPVTLDPGLPSSTADAQRREQMQRTREKLRAQLRDGKLDQRLVEVEVRERAMPAFEIISNQGIEEMDINVKDMLSGMFGQQKKKRKMTVSEAFDYLIQEEENRLIDMDHVTRIAIDRVEQMGILFIDEVDKIAGREAGHGPDVSREGVQRDILPIVEGTTVNTRYGMVRTDHILFIAAGAFHTTKPSDLIPELQGLLSDPRGAQLAHRSGFHSHPYRTQERAGQAVRGASGDRRSQAYVHRRFHRGSRPLRSPRERADRKHRRALACTQSWEKVLEEISSRGTAELKKKNVKIATRLYVQKQLASIVKDQDPEPLKHPLSKFARMRAGLWKPATLEGHQPPHLHGIRRWFQLVFLFLPAGLWPSSRWAVAPLWVNLDRTQAARSCRHSRPHGRAGWQRGHARLHRSDTNRGASQARRVAHDRDLSRHERAAGRPSR